MKKKVLKIQRFLRENPTNWKEELAAPPYNLIIKEGEGICEGVVLFKYDQISSDFNYDLVKECRGIILDKDDNWNVIRYAYNKFFNYGESFAAKIDWDSACVQEKVDGSLITVVYWERKHMLLVSTNGTINAFNTPIMGQGNSFLQKCPYSTFGEIFKDIIDGKHINWKTISPDYTYIFELVSPYNKIVVEYDTPDVFLTGIRNNKTFEEVNPRELDIFNEVRRPRIYSLNGLDECLSAAQALNKDKTSVENEGFVVVDKNWERVKIKSPIYVMSHYLIDKPLTQKRVLEIIRAGEKEEFLTYCPKYEKEFEYVENKIELLFTRMEELKRLTDENKELPQSDFAKIAQSYGSLSAWMFKCRRDNALTPKEWLFGGKKYISKNGEEKISEGIFINTLVELLGGLDED